MSDAKKRRIQTSKDPEVWQKWFNELPSEFENSSDENDYDDEGDDYEDEDAVEESNHDTDSELEVSEDDELLDEEENSSSSHLSGYYIGKDKITKWRKNPPNLQVRLRSHNIVKHLPGTKGNARNATTPIECLKLFINEIIVRIITISTNIYIDNIQNRFQRVRDARKTDEREMSAFIGILFLIGTFRSSRKNLKKIWDNSRGSGIESCYLAMSENRFRFLLRCVRFDNVETRNERRELDKLAPIRELFENFLVNFQANFIPSEFLTVDEQLLAFRGRCGFKQFIPSKPAKYGIKMFALVDAKTSYTMNLETYVGLQPEGPYKLNNSGEEIVLRLVQPIAGTNRNVTGDNWFSSVPLVEKLLRHHKLTYIGTLRKNKREIPPEFLPHKKTEEKSSIFGFKEECTLVSYCPKKNKSVLLLSSMHHCKTIDVDTGVDKKPIIITDYNRTKIGVDLVDQLCNNYNVARNTRRWPMVVFYDLLNISGINALCVFKANHPRQTVSRSEFLEKCAWELIKPQIEVRSTILQLPVEIRRRARHLLGVSEVLPAPPNRPQNYVGRCLICPRSDNKSTRKYCYKCNRYTCKNHMKEICVTCMAE
ncbi:piggyBac transposable element-derived protein 4-like [Coccinella septempunctata]|uniref:piggyBac transposable element-derived protein 4-like n=1 Tax=Coccinella septempunctata TaxID=41139 RepID=UPI001D07927C|nr:piggyBac transposable element-derived protein 4-like [Coccinella septempunctata]